MPMHQDRYDLAQELRIGEHIARLWEVTPRKLPPLYPIDFAMLDRRGEVRIYVEIKRQFKTFGTFPTFYLDVRQWVALIQHSRYSQCGSRLVVQWNDTLAWTIVDERRLAANVNGRKDRPNDPYDGEPLVLVPIDEFRVLAPVPEQEVFI